MNARLLIYLAGALVATSLQTGTAVAQDRDQPPADPIPLERKPEVDRRFMPTPPSRVSPTIPQLQALDIPRPSGRALPEGTFLVGQLGVIHLIETGDLIFAPAVAPGEPPLPVMLVTPSMASARLTSMIERGRFTWEGRISGEVFFYRGRNILLISAFSPLAVDRTAQARPATTRPAERDAVADQTPADDPTPDAPTPDPTTPPLDPGVLDPRVTELADELRSERLGPRTLDPAMDRQILGGDAPVFTVPLDGSRIVRRRARMLRDSNGRWQVRFDQDGDNREAPLTVVPCQLLELMERQAEARGEAWTFQISGRVVATPVGASLIPTLFVADRSAGVDPRQ